MLGTERGPRLLTRAFRSLDFDSNKELFDRCCDDTIVPTKDYFESYLDTRGFNKGKRLCDYEIKMRDLIAAWDQDRKLQTIEGPIPKLLFAAMMKELKFSLPTIQGITAMFFGAYSGFVSEMHFDGDYRNVLLIQLGGRKRIEFKLNPDYEQVRSIFSHSCISLKEDTARKDGTAIEVELSPGDGLVFPGYLWHRAVYVSPGFSLTIRFGNCAVSRFLAQYFHKDFNSRIIVQQIRNHENVSSILDMRRLVRLLYDGSRTPSQKLTAGESLFYETALSVAPGRAVDPGVLRQAPGYGETKAAMMARNVYGVTP